MCFETPDYSGAAAIQAAAANRAADLQYQMYKEGVAREQPWVTAGGGALSQIGGLLNLPGYTAQDPTKTLQATPGYQWGLGQGVQALDRSAASRGMALSGPQRNAIQQFGQNYALQNAWNPYVAQLTGLSTAGQSGAALQAQQGLQTGQVMGQDWMAAANATAQGMVQQQMANNQASSGLFGGIGSALGLLMTPFTGGTSLLGMGASALGGLFGGGGGSGGGGTPYWGGGTGSYTPSIYAGLLAEGGPALADKPYIVGEKGPELFVPRQSGFVVPNQALRRDGDGIYRPNTGLVPYRPAGPPMTERPPRGWNPNDAFPGGYAA